MKKIITTLVLVLVALTTNAQIDRSKQPESGPAPKINLSKPNTFKLNNGLTVMVVENNKLPRVRIQLEIDNPPIAEGNKAGVSSLMSSMLGNGSKNIAKDAFNEEVDYLGARISFGSQSAFASSLSKYFPRILELMADAAINPNFTAEEFEKEKSKLITGLKSGEKDASTIASNVQSALAYGKNHPYGEITTEETVNNVTLADVEEFYRSYFVPANAYLIVIGDITFNDAKKLVTEAFTPWTKAVPPSLSYSEPKDVQYTQINFVDLPNAVQSQVVVENLVDLKMKDKDYLAALIANQVLGGGGEGRLFLNLREDKGYTYGSYSSLRDNKHSKTRFTATAQVRNQVTDSSVVEILKEIERIRKEPITKEELENTKAKYAGRFVMALENPETVANYALNIEKEGLPKDFYENYLERLNAVSIADVQAAANKYFSMDNARVVVVGKGSEVLENLEKVTFNGKAVPVRYFDKNANKTEKPNYDVATPEGVDANTVIEKYLASVGGKEALENVESYALSAEAEMQGMKLELEMKKTSKEQFMQDVKVMGNSMSKQVLDGNKGYMTMQGQRKDLNEDEINKIKEESAPFPELNYLAAGGLTLEGVEMVNGKKAYKIKVTDNKTVYYDLETGLKVQEVNVQEMQGQQMTQTLILDDYREISGIKFPFKMTQTMGPQSFDFIVKEIKVNEGVSPADFE
ncbi:pitrilysin family protein [Flavobacterium sp. ASW18X]|uniref:M16 family metallopeptidase n=1 Tax=Flavobacterium sp. ASW18X TaxID=2572595 RepID=UPI0010AEA25D|nr:pitrilysin family protein [Flavobacterium sp. ASW18X]TKD65357.1 insulinase family protein [Flavobacterium sp. ASW18X]